MNHEKTDLPQTPVSPIDSNGEEERPEQAFPYIKIRYLLVGLVLGVALCISSQILWRQMGQISSGKPPLHGMAWGIGGLVIQLSILASIIWTAIKSGGRSKKFDTLTSVLVYVYVLLLILSTYLM